MEKKKLMLIVGGAAVLVAGYFGIKYLSKSQSTAGSSGVVSSISNSGIIAPFLNPPAGTSASVNPVGGTANPVIAANAPSGYGYNYSANVYTWIGQGLPPNGAWTLPVS